MSSPFLPRSLFSSCNRRLVLKGGISAIAAASALKNTALTQALAQEPVQAKTTLAPQTQKEPTLPLSAPKHGLSIFGDLKYPETFSHFDYVNPQAPKGGEIALIVGSTGGNQSFLTFDTLNMFSQRGNGAAGMGMVFDSLMVGAADEPDSLYGLVAKSVSISADGLVYRFQLREETRFHDSSPLRANDVVFSIETLKTAKAHASYRLLLRQVEGAVALSPLEVEIRFAKGRSRELPLIVATLPIFSQAYYATRDFDASTLESPLGSGVYQVAEVEQGRMIRFRRVKNHWAQNLPVSIGQNNFETIRYEYFRDRETAFQAFSSGIYSFREEFTSLIWATRYNFPALREGKVQRRTLPDSRPSGTQGWFINTRKKKFADPRVREAIALCFDFEWTNKNLMYGLYKRTNSYFENSPLQAQGLPSPQERALLETFAPLSAPFPPEVFAAPYTAPMSDGSGQDRALLKRALTLLEQAGVKRGANNLMYLADGTPLEIEFLEDDNGLDRHVNGFIHNLKLIGIPAQIRLLDPAQFTRRRQDFDFDLVMQRFSMSLTPGEGLRLMFGSQAAQTPGSRNLAGVANPAIDAAIEAILAAPTREDLTHATRVLDRLLRAGHYWVSAWYAGEHKIAWWDHFGMPEPPLPSMVGSAESGVIALWWQDPKKQDPQKQDSSKTELKK